MSRLEKGGIGDPVESKIIDIMRKEDYSLHAVNNYGDNLLHVSAANGCQSIIKEILRTHGSHDVNPRNDCEWTPLMQAIRNGNVETVKLLLENGCRAEHSAIQGTSVIGLAAAISQEMFEIVYEACPLALEHSKNDDIGPLCVAAMKNDKRLFFRLLELGLQVAEANEYTHLMMSQSNVPEIARLAKTIGEIEDYWRETSTIEIYHDSSEDEFEAPQMSSTLHNIDENDNKSDNSNIPSIQISSPDNKMICTRNDTQPQKKHVSRSSNIIVPRSAISPRLEYTKDQIFSMSPNLCFVRRENSNDSSFFVEDKIHCVTTDKDRNDDIIDSSDESLIAEEWRRMWKPLRETGENNIQSNLKNKTHRVATDPNRNDDPPKKVPLERCQMKRPPNLQILKDENIDPPEDNNNDNSLSSEKTPTAPRFHTPPRGMALDKHQKKIAMLLKRFGLTHFIPIFLEQEVDLELFLSVNDQDLQDIGIEKKSDRIILLSVVEECNRNRMFV